MMITQVHVRKTALTDAVLLAREGTEVSLSSSPADFSKFLVDDNKFWVNLVKSANVKVD